MWEQGTSSRIRCRSTRLLWAADEESGEVTRNLDIWDKARALYDLQMVPKFQMFIQGFYYKYKHRVRWTRKWVDLIDEVCETQSGR